jgi:hypothetical protein
LNEYGVPLAGRGAVVVEFEQPDGTPGRLQLSEVAPGVFDGSLTAMLPGIYRLLFKASGTTLRGLPFTREQLRTAADWRGSDDQPPSSGTDPRVRDEQLCHLLDCLISNETLSEFFAKNGIDREALARCVRKFCAERLVPPVEARGRQLQLTSLQHEHADLLAQPEARALVDLLVEVLKRAREQPSS